MLVSQDNRATDQTAVARAVARSVERQHCARDERVQRANRLGRRVAAVRYPRGNERARRGRACSSRLSGHYSNERSE